MRCAARVRKVLRALGALATSKSGGGRNPLTAGRHNRGAVTLYGESKTVTLYGESKTPAQRPGVNLTHVSGLADSAFRVPVAETDHRRMSRVPNSKRRFSGLPDSIFAESLLRRGPPGRTRESDSTHTPIRGNSSRFRCDRRMVCSRVPTWDSGRPRPGVLGSSVRAFKSGQCPA